MLQALWFFIQVALVVGAAIWLGTQPGSVSMTLMDYTFTMHAGVFLLVVAVILMILLVLAKVMRAIVSVPEGIAKYQREDKRKKGLRALTRGLVAVAAGDAKKATHFSNQTKSLLPGQNGLPVLLEAQAARLRGEEGFAQNRFQELMKDKDAAFLGIRGLLKSALNEGNVERALDFARQAADLYPKQNWVIKSVYELEIRNHLWSDVLITGKRADKIGAISKKRVMSDRVAILLMRYDYEWAEGNEKQAMKELEAAYKINPHFVPTVTRLADRYIQKGKNKKAASIVENAWRENPHPDLAELWDRLAPESNGKNEKKILKWYQDLLSFRPDSLEGHIAAARAAMDLGFWGEAKAFLMVAEKIYPSARVFRLRAIVEQNSTHNEDSIHQFMEQASEALPDKRWLCRETGLVYEDWAAIAVPHESFNTIIWDYPGARIIKNEHLSFAGDDNTALLIDPAA